MDEVVTPFRIEVPEAELADLRDRLNRTRWPEAETVDDWSQGVPLEFVRELCRYWATDYDWRRTEARLNSFPQYRTTIDGLSVHFLHVRSPHANALPLILTHGWPGSIVEFLKVIGPLTDPTAHGGNESDAFHVVCPSLPGYGWSAKPTRPGWNIDRIAGAWIQVMARLGYRRYGAAGTDWGSSISTAIGQRDPEHVAGIHLVPPLAAIAPDGELTETERVSMADLRARVAEGDGYSAQQGTRPQTLGYGLVDSPAGQCAWLVDKLWSWSDPRRRLGRDELLDNIMLYWLPGTGASAARLYWESIEWVKGLFTGSTVDPVAVPAGCSVFAKEVPRVSRRWAAKRFSDIRFWSEPASGGHFPAAEEPDLFVADLRAFYRLVR